MQEDVKRRCIEELSNLASGLPQIESKDSSR
jgi:hypothetical protein